MALIKKQRHNIIRQQNREKEAIWKIVQYIPNWFGEIFNWMCISFDNMTG